MKFGGDYLTVLEAVDCVVVRNRGAGGRPVLIGEPGTRQQKDGEKADRKKR